ncbi:MAG TPA: site-2 protease family protein [Acidimicrobiales bacterium]|nr:site-2 protease family protein [Acidimicrobiales bacterium]
MTETQMEPVDRTDEDQQGEYTGKLGLAILLVVVAALALNDGWPILLMIASLVVMIFMHELGHYLTAKWAGMKVTEFFLGFGPRIWSFQRGETEYGIKAIWLGAYVKIIGMNNLDEVDPAEESRTYRQKSYPRRMSVAVAGSTMHFLMALVFAFVALVGYGVYDEESARNWTVGSLTTPEDIEERYQDVQLSEEFQALLDSGQTPATAAGLELGDRIVAADGEEFEEFTDLQAFILDHPSEEVDLTVERGDETFETSVTLGEATDGENTEGFLGLGQEQARQPLGIVEGVGRSFTEVGGLMADSVSAIGKFFTPNGISNFAESVFGDSGDDGEARLDDDGGVARDSDEEGRILSIVGAARIGAEATDSDGISALLRIMVVLNVFIGLFNLIPLLPFDGGHVAIGTYERIREIGRTGRYHADITRMLPVAYAVILFMVAIGSIAIYADIFQWGDFTG